MSENQQHSLVLVLVHTDPQKQLLKGSCSPFFFFTLLDASGSFHIKRLNNLFNSQLPNSQPLYA